MNKKSQVDGAQFDTAIIFTTRMEEMAHFYEKALGIGPYEHSPQHMGCRIGDFYLGFDQVEEFDPGPGGVSLWFSVENIDDTFTRLVEMGVKVRYPPTRKPWGATLAAVYDLDGNILGLSQREGGS
jgi:predicted enzyme related to lactoylglutathione lyase